MTACLSRKPVESVQPVWQTPHHSDVMEDFRQLASRQSVLTMEQLCQLQSRLLGPVGLFAKLARQVAEQGRQAPALGDLATLEGDERRALAEKSVEFALGVHHRREVTVNPFADLQREFLCCVVFDELAPFALVERYAASAALRQRDSDYFIKLIATTRNTVERRFVFHGLLEHYDELLPVERSVYPVNYRAAQQNHLENEEQRYGKLVLHRPVHEILKRHTASWVLANLCSEPDSAR